MVQLLLFKIIALNYSSVPQASLASDWDSETSLDAYIGAIVGKSTERIRFHFGNSNGFADWFAFNSDVKVKGGILNPPTPPTAPAFMAKPIAPKKVEKPQAILTPIILYHNNKVVPKPAPTPQKDNTPKKPTQKSSPKVTITPTYQRQNNVVSRLYTYAKPNFGSGQVITRTVSPTYTGTLPHPTITTQPSYTGTLPHPTITTQPSVKESSSIETQIPKKNSVSKEKDWFGINTGIINTLEDGPQQTDLIAFIKKIGEEAKKKNGNNANAINRDIALTLASPSYREDFLQNLYNTYKGTTLDIPDNVKTTIRKNHSDGKIDFAHVMTTLASLEQQKFSDEAMKYVSSRSLLYPSFLGSNPLFEIYNNDNKRNNILQQNSLVGDLLTSMPETDIFTDMDAIILARHPDYKDLPLDERILKYYGQKDLDSKRKELFLEVYGKNQGKDKGEAQLASFMEIVSAFLTVGGVGALFYSVFKGKNKDIGKNIHKLDTVLYDGNIDKFLKHPLKTTASAVAKTVNKKVIKPVVNKVQKINNKFIKPVIQSVKKTSTKVWNATKTLVTKTVPKTINKKIIKPVVNTAKKINNKFINVVQSIKKTTTKAWNATKTFVTKTVPKTINKKIIKPVVNTAKKINNKFINVVQSIKKTTTKAWNATKTFVTKTGPKSVKKAVKKIVKTIKKAFTPKKKSIKKRRR